MHQGSQVLRPILDDIKKRAWIVRLPPDAHLAYDNTVKDKGCAAASITGTDQPMPSTTGFWDDVLENSSSSAATKNKEKPQFRSAGTHSVLNVTSQEIRDAAFMIGN
mmetsp:Transcript_50320/g.60685  ORF Transcript_50320/g.60685 Transcript_50320/m.60685 type:complete len:107 (-) Transcript_50320:20-340(-)